MDCQDTVGAAAAPVPGHAPAAARRLCLLGGESAGKTSLAQALAQHLHTTWVPEYGRERWLEIGGTFSLAELVSVAREQIAREQAALPQARGWLVCDTSPLTTLAYALLDHGATQAAAPEFDALWAMARRPYEHVFLCAPDFGFVQDGARRDAEFRAEQHALTVQTLQTLGMDWCLLTGPLEQRVEQVTHALARSARRFEKVAGQVGQGAHAGQQAAFVGKKAW
jgi:nicotinamide riboside kinase